MKGLRYILIAFCLCSVSAYAQTQKIRHQPYGDQKLYHFGITVGMNFQDIIFTNNGHINPDGSVWHATIPSYSPGFTVGLLGDLWLNPYMNLRFTPTLNFGDKQVEFVSENTGAHYKTAVKSNYLNIPLDIKFRSRRLNNYRPYLLAGVYTAFDLGRNKGEAMLLKPQDYGVTLGIGCDFYLPIIKVAPELRFSFGLKDIIEQDTKDVTDHSLLPYRRSVSKGLTRMVSLVFNFE
ncbi:PorT family protein [Bacteroidales bacterium OttesenSCG-928-L03]|nr:PorT family protein [Bacteroidales bacterium OttesenSCG-928-L03]